VAVDREVLVSFLLSIRERNDTFDVAYTEGGPDAVISDESMYEEADKFLAESEEDDGTVSEALILHDMFITMVHNTPGRIVSVSSATNFLDEQGRDYEDHELRFRTKDDVVEAFCHTCLVPKEV
jgi:hypothetical protein